MKQLLVSSLIVLGCLASSCGNASTATNNRTDKATDNVSERMSDDEGYLFTTELRTYGGKSLTGKTLSTILAGRVAVLDIYDYMPNGTLSFPCVDAHEYIVLGEGKALEYYPLAQDDTPAEYVSNDAFQKATRKVSISQQAPDGWKEGRTYTFRLSNSNISEYASKTIRVRTVKLTDKGVTLVESVDEDFKPVDVSNIYGKTLVEIASDNYDEPVYLLNGQPVVPANHLETYSSLVVDDKGRTFSQVESGSRKADSRLSYVFGEIPELAYFGWISKGEIVVDDMLYELEQTSK